MSNRRATKAKRQLSSTIEAPKGHVTLGIPSGNAPEAHMARTLFEVGFWDQRYGRKHLNPKHPTCWVIGSTIVMNARNTIVRKFLEQPEGEQSEWLLFLDDDQVYPCDVLEHLIEAADPVERRIVGLPVWRFLSPDDSTNVAVTHNVLDVHESGAYVAWPGELPENALIQVGAVGTGCMLIHRSALLEMQQASIAADQGGNWAWFRQVIYQPADYCEGEDLYFCRLAWRCGIPVWVNTSVTLEHVKKIRLTQAHAAGVMQT
jgi:hypothetical protein